MSSPLVEKPTNNQKIGNFSGQVLEETRIIQNKKEDAMPIAGIIGDLAESVLAEKTFIFKKAGETSAQRAIESKVKAIKTSAKEKKSVKLVLSVRKMHKNSKPKKYSFTVIGSEDSDTGEHTIIANAGREKIIGRVTGKGNALLLAQNAHLLGNGLPEIVGVANAGAENAYILIKSPELPMGLIRNTEISLNNPYATTALIQKIAKLHENGALLGKFNPATVAFTKKGAHLTDIRDLTFVKKGESTVGEFIYILGSLVKDNVAEMEQIPRLISEYMLILKNKAELDRHFSDPLAYSKIDRVIYGSVLFDKKHTFELRTYSEETLATLITQKVARYSGLIAMLQPQKKSRNVKGQN